MSMKSIVVIFSALCFQSQWIYGTPVGVSSYAYQDSAGNRYGGIYQIPDNNFDQYYEPKELQFQIPFAQTFYPPQEDFFPEYFKNFQILLQQAFDADFANQRRALEAAHKAYDLTSNNAGYVPYFPFRSGDFGDFDMFNSPNSAFAGAAAGPGFTHQIAAINPANPYIPNVNKMQRFDDVLPSQGRNYVSMSSKAYSVSRNVNGQEMTDRGAETVVNNNGKVTAYKVTS